jgi:HAE1 family hydrophobic/amphiphilic exporter-1
MNPSEPHNATLVGVKEVGMAVIAGTFTTIIVFVPIMFGVKNDISVFMTHVSVTIIVALLASLLIAQTLVPMLAARVPPPPQPKEGAAISRLTNRYVASLGWILTRPWKTFGGVILICLIGISPLALQLIKFDAFPQDSGRRLYMPLHIEGQHPLERVEAAVTTIEDYLFENQEEFDIRSVYSYYELDEAIAVILLTDEEDATVSTSSLTSKGAAMASACRFRETRQQS